MQNSINLSMLWELGDSVYFRLPANIEHLPRQLRGKVFSATRLAKMAVYTILVLKSADQDKREAGNEFAMAKSAPNAGARNEHFARAQMFSSQFNRRQDVCDARLQAILAATAIG